VALRDIDRMLGRVADTVRGGLANDLPDDAAQAPPAEPVVTTQDLQIVLNHEDGTPMVGATFDAYFGDTVVHGTTGSDGSATIEPPTGHTDDEQFVLVMTGFPSESQAPSRRTPP
jgi:hypothetical protein